MPHSDAAAAPLTDAERAWLHARAAELGVDAGAAYAGPLRAGADGRIVLSTDARASAVAPLACEGGVAFLAEAVHLGAGETLVITGPAREPVRVVLGRLSAEGGRVVVETPVELFAATAVMDSSSAWTMIGRDGEAGNPGEPGLDSSPGLPDAGPGDDGGAGGAGGDGGGTYWFAEIRGTHTFLSRGGNGGAGGHGGRGGNRTLGPSGNGGNGGRGGDGGDGGSVVIGFGAMAVGAAIHPRSALASGGRGGDPGPGGNGPWSAPGRPGSPGQPGSPGELASFSIRYRPLDPAA
jgi:hypothetical protein